MSVYIEQFAEYFDALHGKEGRAAPLEPFPWQSRLARQVHECGWPACIDLPTASGKTAAIDIAVFVLATQAARKDHERTVGRRIFFTVNRRVIVDEAFERAVRIANQLRVAKSGILKDVANALRELNADDDAPPLDVAELRGGIYRDRRWARGMTQPMVVATTADQLGSRLLFRGYGVSPLSRPIHAALVSCDSLILLDEAHCTRAFARTLGAIHAYRRQEKNVPPMRFVQMTATPAGDIDKAGCFAMDDDDQKNPILRDRQRAPKPAALILEKSKPETFPQKLAERAVAAQDDTHRAIGVIVNRVNTARKVHELLKAQRPHADCHLVIGRMRPLDRDDLTVHLRGIVGPDRPDRLERPCFVVATQCLEVGADYDFDTLISECASIDALRQRFGRLNRRGRKASGDENFEAVAEIVVNAVSLKEDDAVYGASLQNTWQWLNAAAAASGTPGQIDFGIADFQPKWDALDEAARASLLAPAPDAAVLLPAHLDALCQTAPEPEPSPDVSFFIHGPQRDNREVQVCWRNDLGDDPEQWTEVVSMLPPTSPECMTVPLRDFRRWMSNTTPSGASADVPTQVEDDDADAAGGTPRDVLIWRGAAKSVVTANPKDLRPGDTIVLPAARDSCEALGHVPKEVYDIAECATRVARRQATFRIRIGISDARFSEALREHARTAGGTLSKSAIRTELRASLSDKELPPDVLSGAFDEHEYPGEDETSRPGIVLKFRELLPDAREIPRTTGPEDDADEPLLQNPRGVPITLAAHTEHVTAETERSLKRLSLNGLVATFLEAARLHDIGKCDSRFQAMLFGSTPEEAIYRPSLLAKSGNDTLTRREREQQRERSRLPIGFRHEMLSVELLENANYPIGALVERTLLLHLIASHHGNARPFAPLVLDDDPSDLNFPDNPAFSTAASQRRKWVLSHRLDSGIAERFWLLTRRLGWWALAYHEAVLRLADQQASEAEQP